MIYRLIRALKYRYAKSSSDRFTKWLRNRGCSIGNNVEWHGLSNVSVDTTRPSLVEIGNNVCITKGFVLLTHGYDWMVLRNKFDEVYASSGPVIIKDNVFIGINTTILKNVTIGSNTIIGACSLVNKDIPDNVVAVGNPARVVCSIEKYRAKRKDQYINEAKVYARSIVRNYKRNPVKEDFWEEFPLFMSAEDIKINKVAQRQLSLAYDNYIKFHSPIYSNFEHFIQDSLNEE